MSATRGHNVTLSRPILLDGANPTREVPLTFPPTSSSGGEILDPARRAAGEFRFPVVICGARSREALFARLAREFEHGSIRAFSPGRFKRHGRRVFNRGRSAARLSPQTVPLPRDGQTVTIRLERGYMLAGQVIDAATGWPVRGAEVVAMSEILPGSTLQAL